jgi:hypothetical protein
MPEMGPKCLPPGRLRITCPLTCEPFYNRIPGSGGRCGNRNPFENKALWRKHGLMWHTYSARDVGFLVKKRRKFLSGIGITLQGQLRSRDACPRNRTQAGPERPFPADTSENRTQNAGLCEKQGAHPQKMRYSWVCLRRRRFTGCGKPGQQ